MHLVGEPKSPNFILFDFEIEASKERRSLPDVISKFELTTYQRRYHAYHFSPHIYYSD